MKHLSLIWLLVICWSFTFGQTEAQKFKVDLLNNKVEYREVEAKEFKQGLMIKDFSALFIHADNSIVYGFIGEHFQRLRIKLTTVIKDQKSPDVYHVYGKSMVKNNIDEFQGTIKISNIRKFKPRQHGCEDESKYRRYKGEFMLLADYTLLENKNQNHAGYFKGSLESDFFISKNNQIRYNDIEDCSDGYTNNQFVGEWSSYDGKIVQRCNWGDFRIPNSGNLDIGVGEFSPNDKYLKYGWQSLRDESATENVKWWQ